MQQAAYFECAFIFNTLYLVSKPPWQKKGMQPTAFLNVLSFSKTSNVVEKGFFVWKKMGAGLKHAQQFRTFILLRPVVTFSIYHHFILFLASGDL